MSYKEEYADRIEGQFFDLENRIIADIVRRIKKMDEITSTADYQIERLYQLLGFSTEEIEERIKEALGAAYPDMFELYDRVAEEEYTRNRQIYEQINGALVPYKENGQLQQWLEAAKRQTVAELSNITVTMGFVNNIGGQMTFLPFTEFYRKIMDAALLDITTGAFDYNSTLKRAVRQMTNSGVRMVDYTSGHHNRITVAARRAVMTGVTQLTGQINEMNAEKLGTEYFEIDWHAGARPSHAEWQGRVWTKEELVTVCGLGAVTGLAGANCYHVYYPFFPGMSERKYTDEWLKEQSIIENTPKAFKDKEYTAYEAKQKQRQMETAMRAQRENIRHLEGGGADADEILLQKCKYQAQLQEYKAFADAMEIRPHMERVYIDGLGRVAPGRGIAPKARSVVKYNKLHYNKDGSLVVTNDWTGQKHPSVPKQFKPYAVIETMKKSTGQRDLTIFDADGWKSLELHSGDHNRPKEHQYGKNGEHSHIYIWNKETGERMHRETHELTEKDRRWLGDRI